MRPDCQLRAFNAEVIDSPIIVLPPCPHSCPSMLVLSFATTGRAALDGVLLFPFYDTGSPRIGWSSAMPPSSFGPSLVILGRFPPQLGPLGLIYIKMGQGTQILWPHNSPSKSCCLDPRTGRRILMFSSLYHGRLSLVSLWAPRFLRLPMRRSWRFGVRGALS